MWNRSAANFSAARRRLLKSAAFAAGAVTAPLRLAHVAPESYEGMHDSATWRREAKARIDANRKTRFSVQVLDAQGGPVSNGVVHARLARHEFGFGAAIRAGHIFGNRIPGDERAFCMERMRQEFHKLGAVNGLKWKWLDRDRAAVDRFLDWAREQGIPVRGHTLVWAGFRRAPEAIAALRNDPPALAAAIDKRIAEAMRFTAGRISDWDVLNEPYTDNEFMQILGADVVSDWFRTTEGLDPQVGRYVNDYGVLTRPSRAHQDFYFDYVGALLEGGVPVTGIGFQAHNPARFPLTSMPEILDTLDRFATFGLDMQITEFDVERTDEELQARYAADFLTAIFSHHATVGLICWHPFRHPSVTQSKPDASFWHEDTSRKPIADAWSDLVNGEWRTDTERPVDSAGHVSFQGFAGLYDITVQAGGMRDVHRVHFGKDKVSAVLRLH